MPVERPGQARSGRVRIVGGKLRNSRLPVPSVDGLRPTPERVRETVFNWLAPVIAGARCLDLCAGTGALGIEALSRGAAAVSFVEREPRLAQALRVNLERLGVGGEVVVADAQAWLRGTPRAYDVVFLDPPFALELWATLARQLETGGWLAPGAMVYVEWPSAATPELPPSWQAHRQARAGAVHYALMKT